AGGSGNSPGRSGRRRPSALHPSIPPPTARTDARRDRPRYCRSASRRMVSPYAMLFRGVPPIGNIWAGPVAHLFGPSAAVGVGGAVAGVAALAGLGEVLSRRLSPRG